MDYIGRIARLVEKFDQLGVDGFVASRLIHCRYFTGFSGSNGAAGIGRDGIWIATDGRYDLQVRAESSHCTIVIERAVVETVMKALAAAGSRRIAVESEWISHSFFESLRLLAQVLGVELVATAGVVEALRIIKEPAEIEAVSRACQITSEAWLNVVSRGVEGQTERRIAAAIESEFRLLGAEDRAFESIVATGPNSAIPHHHPTQRIVQRGDLLKLDIGARVDGYHADMTRTVVVGEPVEWQRELYAAVEQAQQSALALAKDGTDSQLLADVIRDTHITNGYGDYIMHQPGHGVGLEIHEKPFLGRGDGILRPGMPITVEPGLYLPDRGGVRIEDTIEILSDGYRFLTTANRDFISV